MTAALATSCAPAGQLGDELGTRESEARAYIEELLQHCHLYAHIEPTNACNTACTVCPRDAMTRSKVLMPWETFVRFADQALITPLPMVSFVGFGEPTLHRRLPDMLRYLRNRNDKIILKLTTNGALLSRASVVTLFSSGLDFLEVSVIGNSPESYERMMPGLSFRRMTDLIRTLNELCVKYALTSFGYPGVPAASVRSFWQEQGASSVHLKGLHRRGGYLETQGTELTADADYSYRADLSRSTAIDCHKLFMFLHLNASGNVVPCVQEINDKNVLANVHLSNDYASLFKLTRQAAPTFDICMGCELKNQDLVAYYSMFFAEHFPDRLPRLRAQLSSYLSHRKV